MSDQNEHQEKRAVESPEAATEDYENMSEAEILEALEKHRQNDEGSDPQTADSEGEGFSNPLEALAAENTRQEEEIAELKDRMLRAAAEMENLRRRTQKDVADARSYSISGFARDMLSVGDNLRRALEHVDEADQDSPALKSLVEGVEMTERELVNGLEKHGVKRIDPKGEKFDPNFHQAMFEVPNTEVPNNTVMEVVQVGYVIGERVLRPAMVGVSKGGPKGEAAEKPREE